MKTISQVFKASLVISLVLLSKTNILAVSPNDSGGEIHVDDATRKCQEDCVSNPVLYECDEDCSKRYPDEHNLDMCLRYCTREVQICLRRCANLDKYKKIKEEWERLGITLSYQ